MGKHLKDVFLLLAKSKAPGRNLLMILLRRREIIERFSSLLDLLYRCTSKTFAYSELKQKKPELAVLSMHSLGGPRTQKDYKEQATIMEIIVGIATIIGTISSALAIYEFIEHRRKQQK